MDSYGSKGLGTTSVDGLIFDSNSRSVFIASSAFNAESSGSWGKALDLLTSTFQHSNAILERWEGLSLLYSCVNRLNQYVKLNCLRSLLPLGRPAGLRLLPGSNFGTVNQKTTYFKYKSFTPQRQ